MTVYRRRPGAPGVTSRSRTASAPPAGSVADDRATTRPPSATVTGAVCPPYPLARTPTWTGSGDPAYATSFVTARARRTSRPDTLSPATAVQMGTGNRSAR